MIQKNLKGLERMEILITYHMKVFLGNKYNNYIHAARNAKASSTKNVYEKTNETEEERFSETHLEPTRTSTMELFKENSYGVM